MKLVLYPAVEAERLAKIAAAAGAMAVVNATSESEAEREIVDADALFGKLTPAMLAAATRLRWVQTATASLEHYIFPQLVEHPCVLCNMRGLYSDIIADQVLGYVVCFARNLHRYMRQQTQRRWAPIGGESARTNFLSGPGMTSDLDRAHLFLPDQTMGIVGLGAIGLEIARRANAFGMRVVAVDARLTDAPPEVSRLDSPERLPELLVESDFVVIAAPHTPETEKLFNRALIALMKRSAYLINIGRGAIVDLNDLTAALTANEIAGAALDVFEIEPLPEDHPLWDMENVIITPHIAGCAPPVAGRHLEVLLDNIGRFVRNEPLRNVVDKSMWF